MQSAPVWQIVLYLIYLQSRQSPKMLNIHVVSCVSLFVCVRVCVCVCVPSCFTALALRLKIFAHFAHFADDGRIDN